MNNLAVNQPSRSSVCALSANHFHFKTGPRATFTEMEAQCGSISCALLAKRNDEVSLRFSKTIYCTPSKISSQVSAPAHLVENNELINLSM